MTVILRDYQQGDQARVDQLAVEAWEQYRSHYSDWDAFKERIAAMSQLADAGELIVAEIDGRVQGAVAYIGPGKPKSEIFRPEWPIMRMLVVAPLARGQGLDRRLTEACLERARRDLADVFALHTNEMMQVALPMYRRMGFEFYTSAPANFGVTNSVFLKRL